MQWCPQDLAKGGNKTGGLGATPPAANEFLRFSHKKTLFLKHFYIEKGHAVSSATTSVASILQWGGGGGGLKMKPHLIIRCIQERIQKVLVGYM